MSQGKIYLIKGDETLQPLEEQEYLNEDILQTLLAKYPDLLAGEQIDEAKPRRWLLVTREAGVPGEEGGGARWSVDHLFLDQDAIPTLVEVKRSTNTQIRREVVGQMLDYAANAVVYWPVETLRAAFETTCGKANRDPEEVFCECFGSEMDSEAFWGSVKTNLQAGRIRMLFVADEIPPELRRVVEFLNEQMDPAEVLAIEIRQFVGQNLKTLVPRVIGQTASAEQKKTVTRQSRQWDEPSFWEALQDRRGNAEVSVARKILDWSKSRTMRILWGKGASNGSFIPVLNHKNVDYQLFAVYTYGTVEIHFQYLKSAPPFDSEELRLQLRSRLNEIPSVSISQDAITITRRPSIPLATLSSEASLSRFLEVMEWAIQQIKTV